MRKIIMGLYAMCLFILVPTVLAINYNWYVCLVYILGTLVCGHIMQKLESKPTDTEDK